MKKTTIGLTGLLCVIQLAIMINLASAVRQNLEPERITDHSEIPMPVQNQTNQPGWQTADQDTTNKISDNSCASTLRNYTSFFLANADPLLHIFRNSGKDYNDFGRYQDCITDQDYPMRYFLIAVLDKFPVPLTIGLCLPAECTLQDVEDFKPHLISGLNQGALMADIFENVRGMSNEEAVFGQLTASDVQIIESEFENQKVTKFSWGSFLICLGIALAFGMALIAVIISTFKNQSIAEDIIEEPELLDNSNSPVQDRLNSGLPVSSRAPVIRTNACERFIDCFNLFQNIQTLGKPLSKQGDEELEVLNCIRVISCVMVIFGSTYFYMMRGPIQNLEVVQQWIVGDFFRLVLTADLVVDVFFWISAFLASYQLLVAMSLNEGELPSSKLKLVVHRWFRLVPLYMFTLFVFWKFVPLFGGDGPLFFTYSENAQCKRNFVFHMMFINNIIPWGTRDNCMQWSWFLACDLQFFCLVPWLVHAYYHHRKRFWGYVVSIWLFCGIITGIVILKNDFSASYFSYKDSYWQVFYEKPWVRIPPYLLGLVIGCSYYTFKHEQNMHAGRRSHRQIEEGFEERSQESNIFVWVMDQIKSKKWVAGLSLFIGVALQIFVVRLFVNINSFEDAPKEFWSMVYLMIQRPVYVFGSTCLILPLLLKNPLLKSITYLATSSFWFSLARLSYGAYLSHSIFMLYRNLNSERGLWASQFDAFMWFFSYLLFSYFYSFLTTLFVEIPLQKAYKQFVMGIIPLPTVYTTDLQNSIKIAFMQQEKDQQDNLAQDEHVDFNEEHVDLNEDHEPDSATF